MHTEKKNKEKVERNACNLRIPLSNGGKKSNIKEATSREVKPLSLRSSIQGYIFNKYLHKIRSKYVVLGLGFELLNPKGKQIPN